MPALARGDVVTYRGHTAEIVHVYATTASIRFTPAVRGLSPQLDAYLGELVKVTPADGVAEQSSETDPRQPGGRYWCGYWAQEYTVDAMWSGIQRGDTGWMRVRWADGTSTTHCTPWDARTDRVLA